MIVKVCLASLEIEFKNVVGRLTDEYLNYGLVSYYYLKDDEQLEKILSKVKYLYVDSGAHSFQHGKKVDFDKYTKEYAEFCKKHSDNPKILGFFEMDIDNVVGYEKVLEYRKILEEKSNKIIPVWHNNRGIEDFIETCKKYNRISITGFANNDITDSQYNLFINLAHQHNCKIHILGMTRFNLLKNLNLAKDDSFDSSSWTQDGIFGNLSIPFKDKTLKKLTCFNGVKIHYNLLKKLNLISYKKMQDIYNDIDQSN